MRRRIAVVAVVAAVVAAASGTGVQAEEADPSAMGRWGQPFAEQTIDGRATDDVCVEEAQPGDDHTSHRWRAAPPL